jgi:hypothetical protein
MQDASPRRGDIKWATRAANLNITDGWTDDGVSIRGSSYITTGIAVLHVCSPRPRREVVLDLSQDTTCEVMIVRDEEVAIPELDFSAFQVI